MIDGVITQTGNSRLVKANLPATYEEFKAQAAAGTLPIDLLFNAAGWSVQPTFLNKGTLLDDTTASKYPTGTDTVNKALGAVPNITYREIARYDTAGSYTWVPPYAGTFVFLLIGAGGSGSAAVGYSSNRNRAVGGSSGYAKCVKASLPTNTDVTVLVGQGGAAVTANGADGSGVSYKNGNNGGSTSIKLFYPTVAVVGVEGGGGGEAIDTGDIFPSSLNTGAQIGGIPNAYYGPDGLQGASDIDGYWFGIPWTCVNPVTGEAILGGGAGVSTATSSGSTSSAGKAGKNSATGLGGGDAARTDRGTVTAQSATEFGCGGGAAAVDKRDESYTATSGAGADGAVIIYGIEDVDG